MNVQNPDRCLVCQRSDQHTPLIAMTYQGNTYHICPEHLPLLIHSPHKLVGMLPGAENLRPYEQ